MTYAFISDGRLYVRDEKGEVLEIESQFITEKINRSERSSKYTGWKSKTSPGDMYFGGPAIWGQQDACGMAVAYRFKDVITADENTLYYTLTNNNVTGLFRYDKADQFETRLFHSNEFIECGIDYSPERKEFAMATFDAEGRANVHLLNENGSVVKELTMGDSRDSNPSFSLRDPNQIFFQSSGIARDESGYAMMQGPETIYLLYLENEDMQEVLSDENYDFLLPKEDKNGNLYCIRRPYQMPGKTSLGRVILNTILFPFRFAVAVVSFLNAFTKLFNQQSFKANAFSGDTPTQKKYVNILGQTVDVAKKQRDVFSKKEPSLVPGNWELIRMSPDRTFEVIANNVASYDIDSSGAVHYTNGYRVNSMLQENNKTVFRHRIIEKIKASM